MSYATQADLIERWGEVAEIAADRDGDGDVDATAVERALGDASAEIDGALRGRYALPVAEVPRVLVGICVDIAMALLPLDGAGYSERIDERAKTARKLLADIAAGRHRLDLPAPAAAAAGGVTYAAAPRVFTTDSLKDF